MKVVVEGNIGAGKSSFIDYIASNKHFKSFKEPIEKWQNLNGNNLLELFYRDPGNYALAFQLYALMTNLEIAQKINLLHNSSEIITVRERCLDSVRACFIESMKIRGILEQAEFDVFVKWFDFLKSTNNDLFDINVVIYIRTPYEVAYERVKSRQRNEEREIDGTYLKLLDHLYENWIASLDKSTITLITIDGTLGKEEIKKEYKRVVDQLLFIQNRVDTFDKI